MTGKTARHGENQGIGFWTPQNQGKPTILDFATNEIKFVEFQSVTLSAQWLRWRELGHLKLKKWYSFSISSVKRVYTALQLNCGKFPICAQTSFPLWPSFVENRNLSAAANTGNAFFWLDGSTLNPNKYINTSGNDDVLI